MVNTKNDYKMLNILAYDCNFILNWHLLSFKISDLFIIRIKKTNKNLNRLLFFLQLLKRLYSFFRYLPFFQKLFKSNENHNLYWTHAYIKYQVIHFLPCFQKRKMTSIFCPRCSQKWWKMAHCLQVFEDENVSTAIAHNEIDIFL